MAKQTVESIVEQVRSKPEPKAENLATFKVFDKEFTCRVNAVGRVALVAHTLLPSSINPGEVFGLFPGEALLLVAKGAASTVEPDVFTEEQLNSVR